MRKNLIITLFLGFSISVFSQTYDINSDYKISGKLGIGTASPLGKVDILSATDGVALRLSMPTSEDAAAYDIKWANSNADVVHRIQYSSVYYDFMNVNRATRNVSFTGSNVGIGTTNPLYKLDIIGEGTSTTIARISSGGHSNYRQSRGSNSFDGGYLFYTGVTLDWRFQESANGNDLHIKDESLGKNIITFQDESGNIGIGTTSPIGKVDILSATDEVALRLSMPTSEDAAAYDIKWANSNADVVHKFNIQTHIITL